MVQKKLLDLGVTLFGLVASRAFALITSILIARIAGATTFGEYSLFMTIFVIASEIPNAIETTFIRFANSAAQHHPVQIYQSITIIVKICYALIICISGWVLAPFIANTVFNKPEVTDIVHGSMLAASFMCVHTLLVGSYQQRKQFLKVALLRPVPGFGVLLALGCVALYSGTITSEKITRIYLYITIPLAFATLIILWQVVKDYFNESFKYVWPFLRVALLLMVSTLITLVSNRMDIFFLASYLDIEAVGQYGAAIRISVIVALITAASSTIYLPKASEATRERTVFNEYINLMLIYGAIQTVVALAIISNINLVVGTIFGNEYAGIEMIAIVLIVQVLFEAYSRGFQALIQCGPHPEYIVGTSILRLVVSTSLLYFLLPKYGTIGGAISVATTTGVIGLFLVYFALRDCMPVKDS